jgi:hypothetical protein
MTNVNINDKAMATTHGTQENNQKEEISKRLKQKRTNLATDKYVGFNHKPLKKNIIPYYTNHGITHIPRDLTAKVS